ncbi:MAG: hypothetical protein H6970_00800 [Gammaproteobacteria bacterium]|nr:hypothetical protein [Gammaproteobacteria bacterium]MCP5423596.1 hypothetical protein [Gammaproteobacteria bacterium]MCP5459842.1 hypothetical protein [Gammaproteobacteria bacterium]
MAVMFSVIFFLHGDFIVGGIFATVLVLRGYIETKKALGPKVTVIDFKNQRVTFTNVFEKHLRRPVGPKNINAFVATHRGTKGGFYCDLVLRINGKKFIIRDDSSGKERDSRNTRTLKRVALYINKGISSERVPEELSQLKIGGKSIMKEISP